VALCLLLPFQFVHALLEGSDQIELVAWIRLAQDASGHLCLWMALWLSPGVWVVAIYMAARLLLAMSTLWLANVRALFRQAASVDRWRDHLSWRHEVLPFQAGIAVSSVAGYLLCYTLNPLIFRAYGAEYAGRWGMSYTLLLAAASFALLWVSTRVPLLCSYLAQGRRDQAWAVFMASFLRGLWVYLLMALLLTSAVIGLAWLGVGLAQRFLPPGELLLLALAVLGYYLVLGLKVLVRAHRREDFAALFAVLGLATVLGGGGLAGRVSAWHLNLAYAILLAGLGAWLAWMLARRCFARGL
jgi:hypothetical protein